MTASDKQTARPKRKRTDSPELRIIRVECARRGWRLNDLSRHAGISLDCLWHLALNGFQGQNSRLRIEFVLGLPIFSTTAEFQHRAQVIRLFNGFNPFLATKKQLLARAKADRITVGFARNTNGALIECMAAHYQARAAAPTHP